MINVVISIADTFGTSLNGTDSIVQSQPRNTIGYRASVSYVAKSHTFKFGGEYRNIQFNEGQNQIPSGRFAFTRQFTQGPNPVQASANAGHSFGAFLLGQPSSGSERLIMRTSTYGLYSAFFAQDDWKVTRSLTLNFGIEIRPAYRRPGTIQPNGVLRSVC